MAKGLSPKDWTVRLSDDGGTVMSEIYRARFRVSRIGVIQVIWQDGPDPGPDNGRIEQAAKAAIANALDRDR